MSNFVDLLRNPGDDNPASFIAQFNHFLQHTARLYNVDLQRPAPPVYTATGTMVSDYPGDISGPVAAGAATSDPSTIGTSDRQGECKSNANGNAIASESKELRDLNIALGPTTSIQDLELIQYRFIKLLGDLTLSIKKPNTNVIENVKLTKDEISTMVQFLFHDIFGLGGHQRVAGLISFLQKRQDGGDPGVAERALALSTSKDIPDDFRTFFKYYSKAHLTARKEISPYDNILSLVYRYSGYNSFLTLGRNARENPAQHLAFMESQGISLARGQGHSTIIITFLSRALGLQRTQLHNFLSQSRGIHLLVSVFGEGILVLLPPSASNRYVPPSLIAALLTYML